MVTDWELVVDRVEEYTESLGIPEIKIHPSVNKDDFMPADLPNLSGQELSNKLAEYSSYVSYLDAELGRIESQSIVISSQLSAKVDEVALLQKVSKAKAKALILQDPDWNKAEKKVIELESLARRINGIRDGFQTRYQACSRELSRRSSELKV